MLTHKTKEQKERLIAAIKAGKFSVQIAQKLKLMLENGDLRSQINELMRAYKLTH